MEKCAVTSMHTYVFKRLKSNIWQNFQKTWILRAIESSFRALYVSNSWVLFWRWNPLAFCVLTTYYYIVLHDFWPSSEKWTLPYFVFPFYNPYYSQGRSAVRRTSYILAIPRGLKLKGPPGSSSFIKRSTIVCDKSVLMGSLIGIQ